MIQNLVDVFHEIIKYLSNNEIFSVYLITRNSVLDKYVAGNKIYKFWYVKKTQEWVNKIIRECLNKHPYHNRTILNIDCAHLPCSLKKIESISKIKRFVSLNNYLVCQRCHLFDSNVALWYSLGHNMAYSDPCLDFLCYTCAKVEANELFDYYHEPIISIYNENKCYQWNYAVNHNIIN